MGWSRQAARSGRRLAVMSLVTVAIVPLIAGCSLTPSGTIVVKTHPSSQPSHSSPSVPVNSFQVEASNVFGMLSGGSVQVSCRDGGRRVSISGSVQRAPVTIALTNLRPKQNLSDPPVAGNFADLVTMTVTESGLAHPLRYVAGNEYGAYQGVGTLTVDRSGQGGTVSFDFGPPVGQNPTSQASGDEITTGLNDGSLYGRWQCP
jgi:hypothetical protein